MADPGEVVKKSTLATGHQKFLGHISALLFAIIISFSFSIGDLAVPFLDPVVLNALRFVIGTSLFALLLIFYPGKPFKKPTALWRFGVLGGLIAAYFILMFVALEISDPLSTSAVFTLVPLMSAGFGWLLLRQTTHSIVWIGLLIAASGAIWIIFRGDIGALLSFNIGPGEMIFFFGCAAYAAYAPMVRKFNREEPVAHFTFLTLIASTIWISLIGAKGILETQWLELSAIVWIAIAYLSTFALVISFYLIQYASLRLPASKVYAYTYFIPAIILVVEGLSGRGWASYSVSIGVLVTSLAMLVVVLAPDQLEQS